MSNRQRKGWNAGARSGLSSPKHFECGFEGCKQTYSRLEHLERHQLNHYPRETYYCKFMGCNRSFVRQDLCTRHYGRHFAQGNQNSEDYSENQTRAEQVDGGGDASKPVKKRRVGRPRLAETNPSFSRQQSSSLTESRQVETCRPNDGGAVGSDIPQDDNQVMETDSINRASEPLLMPDALSRLQAPGPSSSSGISSGRNNSLGPNYMPMSTVLRPQAFSFSTPLDKQLPSVNYENGMANPAHEQPAQSDPFTKAQQLSSALEIDGSNMSSGYNAQTMGESPYSNREEFTNWWFDNFQDLSSHAAPIGTQTMAGVHNVTEQWLHGQFLYPVMDAGTARTEVPDRDIRMDWNYSNQDHPYGCLTEARWRHILDYMQASFWQSTTSSGQFDRNIIISAQLMSDEHVLSLKNMNLYIDSYWRRFHEQLPILHQPTFSADHVPELLLLAVIVVGAAYYVPQDGPSLLDQIQQFTLFVAWHLRWQCFMNDDFHPSSKLWIFQTLILLEVYEKMNATRFLHERANLHYATTINIIRRGTALVGSASVSDTPREGITPREWWNRWVRAESTRRAAFAAFVLDINHALMFGHSAVMSTHELQLPLPCDEMLWSATSPSEVGKLEASLYTNNVKSTAFLGGLKRMLSGHKVRANPFGRMILLAGLQSISWQVKQRELQVSILGLPAGLGVPGTWRKTLGKTFDCWKRDFDEDFDHRHRAFLGWHTSEDTSSTSLTVEDASVMYHLSHLAMSVDIVEAQILAGAVKVLSRQITDADRDRVRKRLTAWRRSPEANLGFHHAVQLLIEHVAVSPHQSARIPKYSARDDCLIVRPWVLYYAALTAWCYVYIGSDTREQVLTPTSTYTSLEKSGAPSPAPADGNAPESHVESPSTRTANISPQPDREPSTASTAGNPLLFGNKMDANQLGAVLEYLCQTFREARWELLHEAAGRLETARMMLNDDVSAK